MNKKWSIPAALACTSIVALGATARATLPPHRALGAERSPGG